MPAEQYEPLIALLRDRALQSGTGVSKDNDLLRAAAAIAALRDERDALRADSEALREALHRISLGSQNSMTSKEDCGREARVALGSAK